ncbi:e3 ubiquitin-protein ligase march8-like protein [Dermatophagoides farinae]|uniref:E3 ubiquitin-protein ligase march8-like protein n=1 Tax=Dermatophagoides farinae TaxID=6954 RepID=A0A9D4NTR8_DERFA|nr:E3 ubiquitin-protein ligase MARCHF8-like [Dermatophagoides farinae]KAH7637982.1 e3 ubiquitin-protein ligase march8-like protein [Dermatophagoides farinae]
MGRQKDGSKIVFVQEQIATVVRPPPPSPSPQQQTNVENIEKTTTINKMNKNSIITTIIPIDCDNLDNDDNNSMNQRIVQSSNQLLIERKESNKISIMNNSLEINLPICRICHCSNEDLAETISLKSPSSNMKHLKLNLNCDKIKNRFNNVDDDDDDDDPFNLIQPCYCTGTLQYVHHNCLQQWIRSSNHRYCELCKYNFKLKTKNKPLFQWDCMNMTNGERRKLFLHITFNLISMICVFWSIYVIAEHASLELSNRLGWKFWIKMVVITIGLICGIIFIVFQLRLYFSILSRWKQFNQIVIIENVGNNKMENQQQQQQQQQFDDLIRIENQNQNK